MNEIKNVIICGLGAIGTIYADKISKCQNVSLKILLDKDRVDFYSQNPTKFNGRVLDLEYITPENIDFTADLVIISTKFSGLESAIKNLKNFVGDETIILSLLNGVTSEDIIAKAFGADKVLNSYFIGHSAVRCGRYVEQDGVHKIVFGSKNGQTDKVHAVKNFFDFAHINYEIPDDILHSQWLKFLLNVSSNQTSAILRMTFGQMQKNKACLKFLKSIINEVIKIAKAEGVNGTEKFGEEFQRTFASMSPDGKTSMFQDVENNRKTEVEIFAKTLIELGQKHNISTPYNKILKEMIDIIEENYGI